MLQSQIQIILLQNSKECNCFQIMQDKKFKKYTVDVPFSFLKKVEYRYRYLRVLRIRIKSRIPVPVRFQSLFCQKKFT